MSRDYTIRKAVDEDYIDPPKRRAELHVSSSPNSEDGDESEESEAQEPPPAWNNSDVVAEERTMDMTHRFNVEAEWTFGDDIDANSPVEQVREPTTRTVFDYRQAPDTDKWKRLRRIQDGAYSRSGKSRGTQNSEAERRRTIQTFGNQLGCTQFQIDRSQAIMDSIDLREMGQHTTRAVALSIISLVANEDGRWIRDEEMFRSLMRDSSTNLRAVRQCRKLLRRKSDLV